MNLVQIVSIAGSLLVLAVVVNLVRRRRLRERYALLWLVMGGVLLLFSVFQKLIDVLGRLFGVDYPPSFLFLVFLVILSLIALHLTVVVSTLTERTKRIAQELALLRAGVLEDPDPQEPQET